MSTFLFLKLLKRRSSRSLSTHQPIPSASTSPNHQYQQAYPSKSSLRNSNEFNHPHSHHANEYFNRYATRSPLLANNNDHHADALSLDESPFLSLMRPSESFRSHSSNLKCTHRQPSNLSLREGNCASGREAYNNRSVTIDETRQNEVRLDHDENGVLTRAATAKSSNRSSSDAAQMIDIVSSFLFPVSFLFFNVIYWAYYLNIRITSSN